MSAAGGWWAPAAIRLLRPGIAKTYKVIRTKLANVTRPAVQGQFAHVPIRSTCPQPIHPSALLARKRTGRLYSTQSLHHTVRRLFFTSGPRISGKAGDSVRFSRASSPSSKTAHHVVRSTGRAPFASTLRPNLTGGAIARTQGGYTLGGGGGGARYFSHTPAATAQVVQNVSVAMRAFCLSGQQVRYDGLNRHGDRRYRAVSELEQAVCVKMMGASAPGNPGAFIDFHISPTVTALGPLSAAAPTGLTANIEATASTLNEDSFLDMLSIDFARALKDLAFIFDDLKRLAALGNLPISLEKGRLLRVRFPGVDAETVERLCDDIGVQRGVVGQDADFDVDFGATMAHVIYQVRRDDAETNNMPGRSVRSLYDFDVDMEEAFMEEMEEQSQISDPEGYDPKRNKQRSDNCEDLEGIYRFLKECDRNKGRF